MPKCVQSVFPQGRVCAAARNIRPAYKTSSVSLRAMRKSAGLLISWFDSIIGISGIQTTVLRLGPSSPKPHRLGQDRRNQRQRDVDRNELPTTHGAPMVWEVGRPARAQAVLPRRS